MGVARLVILSFFATFGSSSAVLESPVAKVITLLEDLKAEVADDGKAEATSYDTFACFCKDTTDKKATAIKEGQDSIDQLSADIEDKTADKNAKLTEVETRQKKMEELAEELTNTRTRCLKQHADFERTSADLDKAISSLEGAIKVLQAAKPSAFISVFQDSVKQSQALADVLKHRPTVTKYLQQVAKVDPNSPEYKQHSQGIIDILDNLLNDFSAQKKERDEEWKKASGSCEDMQKSLTDQMETTEEAIQSLKEEIETLKKEIAEARTSLIEAEGLLKDDEIYMKDLTERCEARARDWDQRAQMRSDEVQALTQALDILKNDVEGIDSEINKRALLLDVAGHGSLPRFTALLPAHAASATQKVPVSFFQEIAAPSFRARASNLLQKARASGAISDTVNAQRGMVIDFLNEEGHRLKSSALASAVMRISEDPFVKVKALIQKLIQRLLAESASEATRKGFCDTEIGKAVKDRDFRFGDVQKLNSALADHEAKKDELEEELDALAKSLKELNETLAKATKIRADEKEQNLDTIKKAKEGVDAVTKAITILKVFYKKSARAKVSLLQDSPSDESIKGPGFDSAYKGKQAGSKPVIALLETIKADFERTLKSTQNSEKEAAAEFVEFDRVSKADIGGKETATQLNEQDLESTNNSIAGKMKDLKEQMKLVDDAVKAIEDLKPACMDTGMTHKERAEQRKEEIAALKQAFCLLGDSKVEPECK